MYCNGELLLFSTVPDRRIDPVKSKLSSKTHEKYKHRKNSSSFFIVKRHDSEFLPFSFVVMLFKFQWKRKTMRADMAHIEHSERGERTNDFTSLQEKWRLPPQKRLNELNIAVEMVFGFFALPQFLFHKRLKRRMVEEPNKNRCLFWRQRGISSSSSRNNMIMVAVARLPRCWSTESIFMIAHSSFKLFATNLQRNNCTRHAHRRTSDKFVSLQIRDVEIDSNNVEKMNRMRYFASLT